MDIVERVHAEILGNTRDIAGVYGVSVEEAIEVLSLVTKCLEEANDYSELIALVRKLVETRKVERELAFLMLGRVIGFVEGRKMASAMIVNLLWKTGMGEVGVLSLPIPVGGRP